MTRKQTSDLETYADVKVLQDWRISVDNNLKELNHKVDVLPETLMEMLDERYASKQKVTELEETVAPITAFRRRMWAWIVFVVFTVGVLETILINYLQEHFK